MRNPTTATTLAAHALLLALLLLLLFVCRALSKDLYLATEVYVAFVVVLPLVCLGLAFYGIRASAPLGQSTIGWYLVRGWLLIAGGVLAGALLVNLYAYQLDEAYFERRLIWEEEQRIAQGMPDAEIDFDLNAEQLNKPYHAEELVIAVLAGLSGSLGAVVLSLGFGRLSTAAKTS